MLRAMIFLSLLAANPTFADAKSYQSSDFQILEKTIQVLKTAKGKSREEALNTAETTIHKIIESDPRKNGVFKDVMKFYKNRQKRLFGIGAPVKEGHWDGVDCLHTYGKALVKEFPNSKYIAGIKYHLMDVYNPYDLEKRTKAFASYIKKYPKSPYIWEAKLHLARIYDDLWDSYIAFSNSEPDGHSRHKGSKKANLQWAEKYKTLAFSSYAELVKRHPKEAIRKKVKDRVSKLKKNITDGIKYAEPD